MPSTMAISALAHALYSDQHLLNETLQLLHKVCEKKAHFPHSANIHGPVIAYIARNLVWAKIQGVRVLLASCKCVRRSYRLNFL